MAPGKQHVWQLLLLGMLLQKTGAECPDLSRPTNGNVFYSDKNAGTEASYTCDRGYDLTGTSNVQICQADDTWSNTAPICDAKDCGAIGMFDNGNTDTTDSTYPSVVTFTCLSGYDLQGEAVVSCQTDGTWSSSFPTCTIKDCGDLGTVPNGDVSNGLTTFGSTRDFSCDTGYDLNGDTTLTCTAAGTWSAAKPTCDIKDCGYPGELNAGTEVGGLTTFGAVRTYTCNTGYTLAGTSQISCTAAGVWSDSVPTCTIKDCGNPSAVTNGQFTLVDGTTTYESVVQYTCDNGYDLTGSSQATCGADGNWDQATPTCPIHDCGTLTPPFNGNTNAPLTTFGEDGTYTCNTGYLLNDQTSSYTALTVTCGASGWPFPPPTCDLDPAFCPRFGVPASGSISSTERTLGTVVTFTCGTGHDLVGVSSTTCEADQTWTTAVPSCVIRNCGAAPDVVNAAKTTDGTDYGSTATYTCDNGYNLNGPATRACEADGNWNTVSITCVEQDCGRPTEPTNGRMSLVNGNTMFGAVASFTCDTGYQLMGDNTLDCEIDGWNPTTEPTCQIYDCGDLDNPVNGLVSYPGGTQYQASATYTCSNGYEVTGTTTRTCQHLGDWSGAAPTCDPVDCPSLTNPANGAVNNPWGATFGQTVTYTCDEGHDMSGSATATCQADGQWSSAPPTCIIHDCGRPTEPTNGRLSLVNGGTTYGDVASFTCDTGYQLMGDNTLDCEMGGWNPSTEPTCQIYDCGDLDNPVNGLVSYPGGTQYQASATYTCSNGYEVTGAAMRTCEDLGAWSGAAPTCDPVDCLSLANPANGAVSTPGGTDLGQTATYTCDEGHDMTGSATATCQPDGQWSSAPPTCIIHDCQGRSDPANGRVNVLNGVTTYGASASYTCDNGYELLGDNTLECIMSGWSPNTAPTCRIYDCGDLDNPVNGLVSYPGGTQYQATATYTCSSGYEVTGTATRTCEDLGDWSDTAPTCDPVDCLSLANPANGAVSTPGGTDLGQTATYTCNEGHDMTGSATATCQPDGQWSSAPPTCIIHDCQGRSDPANGRVNVLNGVTTYGASASYTCDNGYELLGDNTLECTMSGWSPNTAPTCRIYDCGDLDNPVNGLVSFPGGTQYQATATYTCSNGYEVTGTATRTCQHLGTWSDTAPTCEIVDCPGLTNPANGAVSNPGGATFGQTATYTCDEGHDMTGSATATCQADGQWSSAPPTCIIHDCQGLSNPVHGRVSFLNGLTTYSSVATYTCDTGYELQGDDTLDCLMLGWSPDIPPICTLYNCGDLNNPLNGLVSFPGGTQYQATATYTCSNGYEVTGTATRTCEDLGAWSGAAPTCQPVDCLSLANPANGAVSTPGGTDLGQTATYTCDEGHDMTGSATATCQPDGQWSSAPPTCIIHDCGGRTDPLGGRVNVLNGVTTYGSIASYTCNTGYELLGDNTLDCTAIGWSPAFPPTCRIYDCGDQLASPANGDIDIPAVTQYQSIVTYSCLQGYTLTGAATRICQNRGTWSGTAPTCEPVDCGRLDNPVNGLVNTVSGTTYQQIATYTCQDGYQLVGVVERVCLASSLWSAAPPACVIKDCGPVTAPDNGDVSAPGGTKYGASATYSCDIGYNMVGTSVVNCLATGQWSSQAPTCSIGNCGGLSSPENGQVVAQGGSTFGATAVYTCNTGYNLIGVSTVTCQENELWSSSPPTCQKVNCGILNIPSGDRNLNVDVAGTVYEDTARFTCNAGYQLNGVGTIKCLSTGSWSGTIPTCQAVDCGPLAAVLDNGIAVQTGRTFGETTTYTCNTGYIISPGVTTQTVTCLDTGSWDNVVPDCVPIDCRGLEAPVNGQINIPSTTYQEIAAYTCDIGYNLVGFNHRQCQADGNWNREAPVCQAVNCGLLADPVFGVVSTPDGTEFSQLATYTCNTGYHVTSGSSIRTCQRDGQWDGTIPTCSIHDCGFLSTSLANGNAIQTGTTYRDTTTYTCSNGYLIAAGQTQLVVTCAEDGNWDGTVPTCNPDDCGSLSSPINGEVRYASSKLDSVADYTCNNGYKLIGNVQVVCQMGGAWSGVMPSCVIIDCGDLANPMNGLVTTPGGETYGMVATYTCRTGYQLIGSAIRTCGLNEQWSGEPPACQKYNCGLLSTFLNHGQVVQTGTEYQDTYIYTCDRGYYIGGTTSTTFTITCTATGQWSDFPPTCTQIDCGPLQTPTNGIVRTTTGNLYESVATYMCDTGYQLVGTSSRTCQSDGTWDGTRPVCQIKDCGPLDPLLNGEVLTPGGSTYRQTATYRCNEGYRLSNDALSTRSCEADGFWTGSIPICELLDCGPIFAPPNGEVTTTSGSLFGSRATYTCNTGYYKSAGNLVRECTDIGWSGPPPVCSIYDCQSLENPANGMVATRQGTTYGEVAVYTCNSGYFISSGSETRTCQANGVWDGSKPTCMIYECSSLLNPQHGFVTVTMTDYGEKAEYTCDNGYHISAGTQTRVCPNNSNQWNGTMAVCTIHDCGEVNRQLANGQVIEYGTLFEDTALYTCNNGYLIEETGLRSKTVTCLGDGHWSSEKPTCVRIDCGPPVVPANGRVEISGTGLGDSATYSCSPGYMMIGPASVSCTNTADWSGEIPICQLYDCGPLEVPANGFVTKTNSTYRGIATYSCANGYFIISGFESRMCQDGGIWDGAPILCTKHDCGPLSTDLDNGMSVQTGTMYGDTTTYRCNLGYHIAGRQAGSTTIICTATGQWSDSKPMCVIVDCGIVHAPANGFVRLDDGTMYLAVAIFACKTGYQLEGVVSKICQDNGEWSSEPPICTVVDCGPITNPENGIVTKSAGTKFQSVAVYTCNAGYYVSFGSERRICTEGGTWDGVKPTCSDISTIACGLLFTDVMVMMPGSREMTTTDYNYMQTMVKGLIDKSDIDSGTTKLSLIIYNTALVDTYSFTLTAYSSREAMKNAIDNTSYMPVNIPSNATHALELFLFYYGSDIIGDRDSVPNTGVLVINDLTDINMEYTTLLATQLRVKGMILNVVGVGIADRTSLEPLAFSPAHVFGMQSYSELPQLASLMFDLPHCNCGVPESPAKGFVDVFEGTYYLDEASYSCFTGYKLSGVEARVCQNKGNWDGAAPICVEIDCGILPNPEHGIVQLSGIAPRFGTIASYTCNSGYVLSGQATRYCNDSGVWSPSLTEARVQCSLIECRPLIRPLNGNMAATGTTFGHMARFVCNTGSELMGVSEIMCQADGMWSNSEPICEQIMCGMRDADVLLMMDIYPGMTLEDFRYAKDAIKYVVGKSDIDSGRTKLDYFFFNADILRSKSLSFNTFMSRSDVIESVDGYAFVPTSAPSNTTVALLTMLTLYESNFFGNRMEADNYALLVTSDIPSTPTPPIMMLTNEADRLNINLAIYSLDVFLTEPVIDRDLTGSYAELMSKFLKPNFETPPCNCGILDNPIRGSVDISGTYYLDKAKYSCIQGYQLSGLATRVCQFDGRWDGISPVCIEIDCGPLNAPENGNVFVQGSSLGSTAQFTCETGYEVIGAAVVTCRDTGQWSGREPVCQLIDCGDLSFIENGAVTSAGTSFGQVATYSCDFGHTLTGLSTRVCQSSGQWSGLKPSCTPRDCGRLLLPASGFVDTSNGTKYGDMATYSCYHGYKLVGSQFTTCTANGAWMPITPPTCLPIDCGNAPELDNGSVQYSAGTGLGSTAMFTCNTGYQLIGTNMVTCTENGVWDGDFPICQLIGCGSLSFGNGTIIYSNGVQYTSQAVFTCNQGYRLTGPTQKSCSASGDWLPSTVTTCTLIDCGPISRPTNGGLTLRGGSTVYGQIAEFSCNMGYSLLGAESVVCEASGFWSAPSPVCMITDCNDLLNPADGTVTASETTFGQVAVYQCNEGYDLVGISSRICQLNGQWSGAVPSCIIKDCGTHSAPAFGSVVFLNGTKYGQNAVYLCDEGYSLRGLAARVCGLNGVWIGDIPTCTVVNCGSVPDLLHGFVVNPGDNRFGSVVSYACDTGYKLTGNAEITCQTTGQWTTLPTCTFVDCGRLIAPMFGTIDVSGGTTLGQTAIYSCNSGYSLSGSQTRTCTEEGLWGGTPPTCQSTDCGVLEDPVNGRVTFTGTQFGNSAVYTCNVGYDLIGIANQLCQNDGAWSGNRPICSIRDCGELSAPSNGLIDLSSGTTYGSIATFTCNLMYELVGSVSAVCRADGTWSATRPTCLLVDEVKTVDITLNLNLTVADNVNLEDLSTNTAYKAEAKEALLTYYRSIMGSDLQDVVVTDVKSGSIVVDFILLLKNTEPAFQEFAEATKQLADGSSPITLFNTDAYTKAMMIKGDIVDLSSGGLDVTALLCMAYMAVHGPCDRGYLCEVMNSQPSCQSPPAIANGRVETPAGTLYDATIIYYCNTGYTMVGDNTRTCTPSGDWQPAQPTCIVTDCGLLFDPVNGDVSIPFGTKYQATARYICNQGYTLIGTGGVTCQANGEWSSPPPVCRITRCGTLTHPVNGNVSLSTDGEMAMYRCNSGYRLSGASVRNCLVSNQWEGTPPKCELISCGVLISPANGRVDSSSGLFYGQTVTYSCVGPEYELIGPRIRTCTEDGTWSGVAPICSLRDCGMLNTVSNGNIVLTGTKYGDTASFTCNSAYSLQGAPLLTCLETGWNQPQPVCLHIGDCGLLSAPDNGTVDLSNGTAIGAIAQYSCILGYVLTGSATRICGQDSAWEGTKPTCKIQTCPQPADPADGMVELFGGLTYGQTATYTCDIGYYLTGPATVTCQEDGTWSAITMCNKKNCGALSGPENGMVDIIAGTEFGSFASYTCNPGYMLMGTDTRVCQATGMWSEAQPSCMAKDCGNLSAPINGAVDVLDTTFGNIATYTCDLGYNLTGSSQQQCGADGRWTGSTPVCALIECTVIGAPDNGRVTLTQDIYYGSVASYLCDIGYRLLGQHVNRTCMANGLWSGAPPACVQVDCGQISAPMFGSVTLSSGTSYGSSATFTCSTGYTVDTPGDRICQADGQWSGTVALCVVVDCGPVSNPKHGKVSIPQGTRYGRTATYSCNSDYDLDGAKTRTCQADGTWSQVPPTCDSGTNFKLAIGLGVGLSGFFIIVLVVILVSVILYRRNIDRHEMRMKKYDTRSKIITTASSLPVKTKPHRSFYLPYFRPTLDDDGQSGVTEYRTRKGDYSYNRMYYNDRDLLPRDEYERHTPNGNHNYKWTLYRP